MILQSLNELYTRLAQDPSYEIAPPGFSPQKISYRIVIKTDGSLVSLDDARIKDSRGKLIPNRLETPAHEKRTSGIKAQFLCDKPEYLLGNQIEGKRDGFGSECFKAFREFHLAKETEINSPRYSSVCRFLEKWSPELSKGYPILEQIGANFGVWQIQGEKEYVHSDPAVRSWWIQRQTQVSPNARNEQCLVSGKTDPICRIHPDIKGFKSSIALVGIQENTSYESYARSKTDNCPISEKVAFRYATALNAILDGPMKTKHRFRVGDITAVFWTEKPAIFEDIFANIFSAGSNAIEKAQDDSKINQIQRLLKAIRSGGNYQEFGAAETAFYILGLEQPNPGRFSIRFFHRSTLEELIKRLHEHHKCLRIIRMSSGAVGKRNPDPEFPSIMDILKQTPPPKGKFPDESKIPPLLAGALARSIIEGCPYPESLFSAIIRRIHADHTINYLRAATLKAILVRNHYQSIPVMLDQTNTNPAYLLGRLFSALEKTQEDALSGVNAGIRDRFYSSASSTPASVFPRLLRTYQHHLSKLKGGAKVNRERLVQEIISSIDSIGFPNHLPLKSQGIFAIGYYHQSKDFFTKKETKDSTVTAAA